MTNLLSTKKFDDRVKEIAALSNEELLSFISSQIRIAYINGYNKSNLSITRFQDKNFDDMSMGEGKVLLDCYLKDKGYEI